MSDHLRPCKDVEIQRYGKHIEDNPSDKGVRHVVHGRATEMDHQTDDRDPERIEEDQKQGSDRTHDQFFRFCISPEEDQKGKESQDLQNTRTLKINDQRHGVSHDRVHKDHAVFEVSGIKSRDLADNA